MLSCALLLSPPAVAAQEPASAPVTLRVLTYNIHHGEGRDGRFDLARTADVIRGAGADLVALQEVDRTTTRSAGVDQLGELARLLGMHAEFGKAMDFQGGGYGVAVLSRWPIASAQNGALPQVAGHEPRTALTVRVHAGREGPWVRFTTTHLDETREPEARLHQVRGLLNLLADDPEPLDILTGDFNARLETDVMLALDEHWTNAVPEGPQGPAPGAAQGLGVGAPPPVGPDGRPLQPRRGPRGDFVLFRPSGAWRVVESRAIDDVVASDHRPVLTVLERAQL